MPDGKKISKDTKDHKDKKDTKDKKDKKLRGRTSRPDDDSDSPARRSRSKSPRDRHSAASASTGASTLALVTQPDKRKLQVDSESFAEPSSNFFAKFEKNLLGNLDKKFDEQKVFMAKSTTASLHEYHDQVVQPQLNKIHEAQTDTNNKVGTLEARMEAMELQNEETRKQIGILNTPSATPSERDADLYERIPDLGILNINTLQGINVTKASVIAAITPCLEENGISKTNFRVEGRSIDNKFVLRPFFGNGKSARLLRNAKNSLRVEGDGDAPTYKELLAQSTDSTPVDVKLFLNYDESRRQRRENGSCRSLFRIIKEMDPKANIRKNRSSVEWNGNPILRVSAPSPDSEIDLQFIERFFSKSPFDAETIKTKFAENKPQTVDEAEWQSL